MFHTNFHGFDKPQRILLMKIRQKSEFESGRWKAGDIHHHHQ